MSAHDLDPHFFLPLWQALVRYLRAHPPVVQAPQQLGEQRIAVDAHAAPARVRLPAKQAREAQQVTQPPGFYLPKDLERRLPHQPSP